MSAIRSRQTRTSGRATASSPYARPPPKKSSWSIAGLLSYFLPSRTHTSPEPSESQSHSEVDASSDSSQEAPRPSHSVSRRRQQVELARETRQQNAIAGPSHRSTTATIPPPPSTFTRPPKAADGSYLPPPSSPAKNIEAVTNFLVTKADQTLTHAEVESVVSLLGQSTPSEKPEPFRFSTSSPSSPARGNTPIFTHEFQSFTPGSASSSNSSPAKTLNRNPNGVYRWSGAGSAKPRSRNRFSSPAFGPSRSTANRIVLKESSDPPRTDTKRRRVGEDASTSTAPPTGNGVNGHNGSPPARSAAPGPSPTRAAQAVPFPISSPSPRATNGVQSNVKPNGIARLRLPALPQKPTAPAIPSPLRQAWSEVSTPIPAEKPQPPQKQTKAANFMTELIKEVTPPKRPDVSNPYQAASPIRSVSANQKQRVKRTRASAKAVPPKEATAEKQKAQDDLISDTNKPQEKQQEYSSQAIIEATLPKGSKRSRPPARFEKPAPPSEPERELSPPPQPRRSARGKSPQPDIPVQPKKPAYTIEEVEDEDEAESTRVTKKAKASLVGLGAPSALRRNGTTPTVPTPEIVVEEVDDDMDTSSNGATAPSPKPARSPSPVRNNAEAGVNGFPSFTTSMNGARSTLPVFSTTAPKEPSKLRNSFTVSPPSTPPHTLPENSQDVATLPHSSGADKHDAPIDPRAAALALPKKSLPSFTFSVKTSVQSLASSSARAEAASMPPGSLPSFTFKTCNGINGNVKVTSDSSSTPNGSTVSSASSSPALVKAFDWSAAGVKAPPAAAAGWTCSTCMLSNPASATDKCTVCETPR